MSAFRFSMLVLVFAIILTYFYSEQLQSLILPSFLSTVQNLVPNQVKYIFKEPEKAENNVDQDTSQLSQTLMFTKEELWQDYRGTEGSKGLYLAFFGKVYDVSEGKQYYAPGGGYDFFAGRDGTKGFVTGDFTEKGLTDNLDELDASLFHGFEEWVEFYEKTYKFVGYLIGNFYDEKANPTSALKRAQKLIEKAKEEEKRNKEHQRKFPMCNSESSAAKGSRVWCSKKSGGIVRDWVGVPRLFHYPGTTSMRCACIRTTGPPSEGVDKKTNRGDLDNPNLKEYADCPSDAISCVVSKPK